MIPSDPLPLTVDQIIMETGPGSGAYIIAVHDQIAVSGRSVTVEKDQVAVRQPVKLRIGYVLLPVPRHRYFLPEFNAAR